jgi:hypothetical protein
VTTFISAWWEGTAHSVDHNTEITSGVAAGSVLCYIEARAVVGLASGGLANTASSYSGPLQNGVAIGAVATGSGAPDYDAFGETEECIWWGGTEIHSDGQVWGPSTDDGFYYPVNIVTIRWRGARYFADSMDWYLVFENEAGNDTAASAFVRLGFW